MLLKYINKAAGLIGFKVVNLKKRELPLDFDKDFLSIYKKCSPFTMTSPERMYATYSSVKYIVENNIEGDIIECGVWRGGSIMIMAIELMNLGINDRDLFLYDTFEGMPEPSKSDIDSSGKAAIGRWSKNKKEGEINNWCYAPLEDVRRNILSTGYPEKKIHFIKGKVEKTIPSTIDHKKISILRLDTDWYESSYHELKYLFSHIATGGILMLDDYGFWEGQRNATDQFFSEQGIKPFLFRIDNSGSILVKY